MKRIYLLVLVVLAASLLASAPTSAKPPATEGYSNFKVFANNDLGMHCVDKDFSVFSILPPYNVLLGQVVAQDIRTGKPALLGRNKVILRYSAVRDNSGSINSTVQDKTNFWRYASPLFGADLDPRGQGLKGLYLPADAQSRAERKFSWHKHLGLFAAEGIPMLPIDDAGKTNRYPLLRVTAFDKASGAKLASVDTVVPVSEETTCSNCHATGALAATGSGWSDNTDLEVQTRTNVLILHDRRENTRLIDSQPVLCASCHYSPALDLAGNGPVGDQVGKPTMSRVMHDFHAAFKQIGEKKLYDEPAPVAGLDPSLGGIPPSDQQTCYQCHPGADTKCLRGAMTETVTCQNCHGSMQALGGHSAMKAYGAIDGRSTDLQRHPWSDEPRCQSCHTGDALNHITPANAGIDSALAPDGMRLQLAYDRNDPAASPLLSGAAMGGTKRFAENDGKLFRHSKGHGGVACEGCHGSTHAIWPGNPATQKNDNKAAVRLQGHAGTISECSTCHRAGSLPLTLNGPHGLHNIDDPRWTEGHEDFYAKDKTSCQTCHGADLRGTVLSRTAVDRSYKLEHGGSKFLSRGTPVGCYTCHNGPGGGDD